MARSGESSEGDSRRDASPVHPVALTMESVVPVMMFCPNVEAFDTSRPPDPRVSPVPASPSLEESTVLVNSASLTRWEKKIKDFEDRERKKRVIPSVSALPGPSPVSSRTRTGLKRSSSFGEEDSTNFREDRTSVSLRKTLAQRKSRDSMPRQKKGKIEP